MDEESSMSSYNDENDENLSLDKENQQGRPRSTSDLQDSDDDETDDHQRFIYEQQQYQRSQFYHQRHNSESPIHELNDEQGSELRGGGDDEDDDDMMDDELLANRTPRPVPDYLIDKIENERWPFVNGHYDSNGEWKEWSEVSTAMNTYSGELVTILEYTIC